MMSCYKTSPCFFFFLLIILVQFDLRVEVEIFVENVFLFAASFPYYGECPAIFHHSVGFLVALERTSCDEVTLSTTPVNAQTTLITEIIILTLNMCILHMESYEHLKI